MRVEKCGVIIIKSLIDVLLSNRFDVFQYFGNYYFCLSDYVFIYGVLKQKINFNKFKCIIFRSYKNFDFDVYK